MKRSFFVSISLAALLSLSLAAAPMVLAAPQSASKAPATQLQTTAQKVAAKKTADIAAATKKVNLTKAAASRAATAAKKAADTAKKAAATAKKAADTAKKAATLAAKKKTTANKKAAQRAAAASKKAATASKKAADASKKAAAAKKTADAQYAAAQRALAKLKAPATATASYTVTYSKSSTTQAKTSASTTTVDAKAIVGMTQAQLTAKYGKPNRTEPSEYGFTWYVYNSDYSRFLMAGVRGGAVVAVYTNAKGLKYGSALSLGTGRSKVRAALGKPVTSLRSGNTIALLPHTDEMDVFVLGGNNVTVFYDVIEGNVVTSVMVLPSADEVAYVTGGQKMTAALGAAYQRLSFDLTNAIRVRRGLKALKSVSLDSKLALSRSTDMRDRNYFDHFTPENKSPADQARKLGVHYLSLGENIAYGHRDAIFASERFMNSPGHRANVLKDYTGLGVGVAVGGKMRVIITCIFTK